MSGNSKRKPESRSKRRPKYFSNKWRQVKELPEEMIPQLEVEEILEKSWSLIPSKNVIIRCEDRKSGKVKEFSFQREDAWVRRVKRMQDTHHIIVCTDEIVGVVLQDEDESDYD